VDLAIARAGEDKAARGDDGTDLRIVRAGVVDAFGCEIRDFAERDLPADRSVIEVVRGK